MKEVEINFRLLFESSPDLYLVLSPNLTIVGVNENYLSATMTIREAIVGKNIFDVFPDNPDDSDATGVSTLRASLLSVLKERKPNTMAVQKYDIRQPDGQFEERYWSPRNSPVLNAGGEVEYIIHRVEDVTEFVRFKNEQIAKNKLTEDLQDRIDQMEIEIFRRAQEIQTMNADLEKKVVERTNDLMNAEVQFRKTLDTMLEGVQVLDFDWNYIYVNDSVCLHGKFPRHELLGYKITEKYKGIENTEVFKAMKRCMTERISMFIENEFVYPDNTTGWFQLSIQPVPEGIFILSIDISERKKAEAEVNQLNETLERRIVERTAQLESVNKELEAFSYSVSHDLRAPLRAIDGYARILEEDYSNVFDSEGKRLLNAVQYNATKMGTLIDDLLAFSRLGRKELVKATVNMQELTEGTLLEVNRVVKHNAEIIIKELSHAPADYSLMSHVLVNLLSNAIKYSSKAEKPVIEIRSEVKPNELIYSVKDNGVGFDMKYAHKLFGVFQRLHKMEEFDGTGVGLAIVQRIINKHGGRTWAEAAPGKGATFYFSLPK